MVSFLSEEHKLQVFQMKVRNKIFDRGSNNTAPLTAWSKACELGVVQEKSFQCLYFGFFVLNSNTNNYLAAFPHSSHHSLGI